LSGRLWLIPVPLGPVEPALCLPAATLAAARRLDHFYAESARSARAFLKALPGAQPLAAVRIDELPRRAGPGATAALLEPLRAAGGEAGVISEAGAPGIADPGADLVAAAHAAGLAVIPCIGPSAILLALMASGMDGQRFSFNGYLPVDRGELARALVSLEARSAREQSTQLWIETPYRNDRMRELALSCLQPQTRLCCATDLTLPGERVRSAAVAQWRRDPGPSLDRQPTVFALRAAAAPGTGHGPARKRLPARPARAR
jgi:16S rRNA (cytidine1402-2'-O)-methyltransferase